MKTIFNNELIVTFAISEADLKTFKDEASKYFDDASLVYDLSCYGKIFYNEFVNDFEPHESAEPARVTKQANKIMKAITKRVEENPHAISVIEKAIGADFALIDIVLKAEKFRNKNGEYNLPNTIPSKRKVNSVHYDWVYKTTTIICKHYNIEFSDNLDSDCAKILYFFIRFCIKTKDSEEELQLHLEHLKTSIGIKRPDS